MGNRSTKKIVKADNVKDECENGDNNMKETHVESEQVGDMPTTVTRKMKKNKEGAPGFQLTDWLELVKSPNFTSKSESDKTVTRAELKKHVTADDCWTILHGNVYDITAYMAYHPGGKRELMKGAGKDCTPLFNKFHAYVEYELILAKCEIGVLVEGGGDVLVEGDEDEEDDDEDE